MRSVGVSILHCFLFRTNFALLSACTDEMSGYVHWEGKRFEEKHEFYWIKPKFEVTNKTSVYLVSIVKIKQIVGSVIFVVWCDLWSTLVVTEYHNKHRHMAWDRNTSELTLIISPNWIQTTWQPYDISNTSSAEFCCNICCLALSNLCACYSWHFWQDFKRLWPNSSLYFPYKQQHSHVFGDGIWSTNIYMSALALGAQPQSVTCYIHIPWQKKNTTLAYIA